MQWNKIINVIISGIIIILFIFTIISLGFKPLDGDLCLHAHISKTIVTEGYIPQRIPLLLATNNTLFPIAYPQLFHLTGGILYLFVGNSAFKVLPLIYSSIILLTIFLLIRLKYNSQYLVFLGIFLALTNSLFVYYSTKYFMEIGITFFIIATIYFLYQYLKNDNNKYLLLSCLFMGSALATKQQSYLLFLLFLMVAFWKNFFKELNIKKLVVICILPMIIASGPMFHLFLTTGSFMYSGDVPAPVQVIEEKMRDIFNVRLVQSSEWIAYGAEGLGRELRMARFAYWMNPENIILYFNPFFNSNMLWVISAILGCLLLSLDILRKRDAYSTLMVGFILLLLVVIFLSAQPRYALALFIFPIIIFLCIVDKLKNIHIGNCKYLLLFFISIIIILSSISFAHTYTIESSRLDIGYLGATTENRMDYLMEAHDWLKKHDTENKTILSPVMYLTAYYTEKPSAWINPFGSGEIFNVFLEKNERDALNVFSEYNVRYILIYKDRVRRYTGWVGIIPIDGLYSAMSSSTHFKRVFENRVAIIYQVNYTSSEIYKNR